MARRTGTQRAITRVELRTARALLGLPPRWQVRLSGQPAVQLDGLTLDPQLQLLLALRARRRLTPLPRLEPAEARQWTRADSAAAAGRPIPVGSVADLTIDGAAGPLAARHYRPDRPDPGPHPLLVFFHGGGFVLGDLDTHDQICRLLCRYAGVHVLAVDYRLAPEHPYPAAVEDAAAALSWTLANASRLDADPARIGVGGDSAGGNLSAVVSIEATRSGGPAPLAQLLLYPAIDRGARYPSLDLFGEGFFLTRDEIDWFQRNYAAGRDRTDPRLSPLHADDLSGLPPALVVTAGFDPLRDEGEAYAAALRAAGTPVTLRRESALIHAFANMIDLSLASRRALVEVAAELRTMLEAPKPAAPEPGGTVHSPG